VEVARVGQRASPPMPVPRPLRPLLRFARLHEPALATVRRVLDEDEAFRHRVVDTLDAAGVRTSLDEASLLFLERPEGWSGSLAALAEATEEAAAAATEARAEGIAARRLGVVQAALDRAEAALDGARLEAEALRRQVGEERRAKRDVSSDLGRLRKRLEELETERSQLRADPPRGAGDRAALEAALAAAEERAFRSDAAAEELRRAAGAAPPAMPAASGAVPVVAGAPSVDQAAAMTAVNAAVDAVGALAEALGRAAAALAPADPVQVVWPPDGSVARVADRSTGEARAARRAAPRTPAHLPPGVFDDTAMAADHLLRLPGVLVLVDGYNVTISTRGDLTLPVQRRWLVDAASGTAARTGAVFEVVFDGAAIGRLAGGGRGLGVHVRFTAPDEEADDVVLDLVRHAPGERPVVVVSDDHRVRDGARRLGANVLGVAPLVEVLRR